MRSQRHVGKQGDRLDRARLKILAAMPVDWRADALRISSRLYIDPDDWYREGEVAPLLTIIAAAVWTERQLRMRYRSWKATTDRTVSPIGLVLKTGQWHFVGAGSSGLRTYRVASVLEATLLEVPAHQPEKFNLATYWKEAVRRLEADLYPRHATVLATAEGLRRLSALGRPFAQAVTQSRRSENLDEWVELNIPLEDSDFAIGQLAHLAPDVEILRPLELRAAIARRLEAAWSPYRRDVV